MSIPENDSGTEKKFAGFSDYEDVASQLHDDVNKAVKAFAHIDSRHKQNMGITPQTALNARQAIVNIAKRLALEIKRNKHVDELGYIHDRWTTGENGEPGYLDRLEGLDMTSEHPGWLSDMVDDIIEAAWELGYTKAGVERPADPDSDENQIEGMFE